jgi:hypothetical protein
MTTTARPPTPPTSPPDKAEPAKRTTGAKVSIYALAMLNIVSVANLGGATAQGEWTELDERQLIRLLTDSAS